MRLRDVSTGVVVSVDDARGAEMIGQHWELADAPADQKESAGEEPGSEEASKEAAPAKRRSRPRKTN